MTNELIADGIYRVSGMETSLKNGAWVSDAGTYLVTDQTKLADIPEARPGDIAFTAGYGHIWQLDVDSTTWVELPKTAAGTAATQAAASATAAAGSGSAAATSASQAQTVAASIHADYTELSNDVADLKEAVVHIGDHTDLGLYGVKWDRLTNRLTRIARAADITTDTTNFGHFGTINENYDNPFDKIYPWSEMFQCNVDLVKYRAGGSTLKDCITAVYGDPDFTYEGSSTNFVGRYRPEFWHKSEEDEDGNVYFYVSQVERTGFIHAEEAIDGISVAIDNGDGGVTCGSGVVLTNIPCSTIHARAKNCGFTLQDIAAVDAQIILYLVEYANMNSQQALGDGCSSCYRENDADAIADVSVGNGETTFTVTDSALSSCVFIGAQADIGATKGAVTYRGIIKDFSVSGSVYTIKLDRELAVADGMIMSIHGFSACEFNLLWSSVGNASGYIGVNTKANAWYRGAVMYANRYQYILGIYRQQNTNHLWICPDGADPDDYDALNTGVHQDTGVVLPDLASAGWQTVGGNAQRIDGLSAFMATGASQGRVWPSSMTNMSTVNPERVKDHLC